MSSVPQVRPKPKMNGFSPSPGCDEDSSVGEVVGGEAGGVVASLTCALLDRGRRCTRQAGNASYSKRVQKTVVQRQLRLALDQGARHVYICDHHKNMIQIVRTKRKRRDSEESGETEDQTERPDVDLFQLQMNTLRRYKKHFKVTSRPGLNKSLLADSLTRHFRTIPVVEKEALTFFIYMVKTSSSKLDKADQTKSADTE